VSHNQFTTALGVIAIGGAVVNSTSQQIILVLTEWSGGEILAKLFQVSFLPWFFMFLLGVIAQRTSRYLIPILLNYSWQTIGIYIGAVLIDFCMWSVPVGNHIPAYLVPIMGAAVLVCGYLRPSLAGRILHGNDISYGLYIYHMPVINAVLYLGSPTGMFAVFTSLSIAITLAFISWTWVERPFLRRKRIIFDPSRTSTAVPAIDSAPPAS
jgi:peptidoglycan/LPS O-acetylase OafA/YrhL